MEVKRHPITEMFVTRTPEFISGAVFLTILLVYDQVFIAKLVKLLPTLSDKKARRGTPLLLKTYTPGSRGQCHASE